MTEFGVWRIPLGSGACDGIQFNLAGGIFSQFNLSEPSEDLLNTDFTVGFPVAFRFGRLSGRVQVYHQSSHLGDEFLLNSPGVFRHDLNLDWVDALLSVEGERWRIYGGGGYWFGRDPNELDLEPLAAQWGGELRSRGHPWWQRSVLRGVAGADFQAIETRDWDPTISIQAGVELARGFTRMRLLATYLRGPWPYGQFFLTEEANSYGVELQMEF